MSDFIGWFINKKAPPLRRLLRQPPLGCPHVRKNEKIAKRRAGWTVHLRPALTVLDHLAWPRESPIGLPNSCTTTTCSGHLKSLAPQPPLPRSAPKPSTPPLQPAFRRHIDHLKLKAPPIPTNSEQFRPNDTSEKFFLPKNTSRQLSSGGLANPASLKNYECSRPLGENEAATQNPRLKTENSNSTQLQLTPPIADFERPLTTFPRILSQSPLFFDILNSVRPTRVRLCPASLSVLAPSDKGRRPPVCLEVLNCFSLPVKHTPS